MNDVERKRTEERLLGARLRINTNRFKAGEDATPAERGFPEGRTRLSPAGASS